MAKVHRKIEKNEVHIWTIPLDRDDQAVGRYYQALSTEERKRAARFHFERHRRRYTVSHGAVREILAGYLVTAPAEIQFDQTDHGKPALSGPFKTSGLYFNLTHSHELAVVGLVRDHEIGVDVEYVQKMGDIDGIASRFFSSAERAAYLDLAEDQRALGFFNCWTRKEAFIKAIGEGLSHPLDQFDVNLAPGVPASLLRIGDDDEEAPRWTLEPFKPEPDYIGAVALRAREVQVRFFRFGEGGNEYR
jgi:4'-phosphopantetheinyl transferase